MSETIAPPRTDPSVETVLGDELANGDAMLATIGPILRHLLANDDHSLFSDEIVARVRGMITHLATQLLDAIDAAQRQDEREHDEAVIADTVAALAQHPRLLAHLHALALEFQLVERLHGRLALDPVLSPLLQALIASPDNGVSGNAMALLAAQARFVQTQRRMQLPLAELSADQLHAALGSLSGVADDPAILEKAQTALRSGFDEGRSRLGLMARLIMAMGGGATAALTLPHAGASLFLTALSLASGQDRDITVLSTNEAQLARLALALRATGMRPETVEQQFLALHPDISLPDGFDRLGADRAAALLARSAPAAGA